MWRLASEVLEPAADTGISQALNTGPRGNRSQQNCRGHKLWGEKEVHLLCLCGGDDVASVGVILDKQTEHKHQKDKEQKLFYFFPTVNCRRLGQCLTLLILFLKGRKLQAGIIKVLAATTFSNNLKASPRFAGCSPLGCC